MNIRLQPVSPPKTDALLTPINLTNETLLHRKQNLMTAMREQHVDSVIIYADREHGDNFEYFTGFVPRFEEALLIVHQSGKAYVLLGNENMKMAAYSRIDVEAIHVPFFSLPNQPMKDDARLEDYFQAADISTGKKVGVIGWKLFTSTSYQNQYLFDLPYYLIDTLKHLEIELFNFSEVLISPEKGIRTVNNANEIAHFEYGAALAGRSLLDALDHIDLGKTEIEIAGLLASGGQPQTVTTICATGDRFTDAVVYPRNKAIQLGDKMSLTIGFKGGLSSRSAYAVSTASELPVKEQDYVAKVVTPYFRALATWLQTIQIGISGDFLYQNIQTVLPQEDFHWELNPGHFTATEEWLASPFYPGSTCTVKSGQIFQIDIIPSVAGFAGVSAEEGIAIADKDLRTEIQTDYPLVWERIMRRRNYLKKELGIELSEEILPMSDTLAYYRPYLLDKTAAMVFK
ncbi:Xaa-Pro aminopeptidase [Listeria grayi]|uniref:Creatinase N-terminal domain-containing protein n=1 Tax=Listeria grayi FSL F6-1183 TaxID=1265827 RepID=A0A829R7Q0_LISGR|nr:aminopeptidase P family N-terminal domain-containing protein [Listeria grayi]EUJ28581.1 hypothetical protein LMUR_05742 [Listeria grayi FSL F6-1183]VEI30391.1 Xaa-Pro aminopeptidase [Listeria grayi]